ncbi:MAG: T9SS type A sorting domain-containing protein, partial [Bacteroidia bacterium]|nr:T9SS type A sorting domain-containing protein [Bacteroidia bacterium]
SIEVTINAIPLANAGLDQSICANSSPITLSGSIGGSASSSYWKTTGTGTFNDSNLLNAIYTPSLADRTSGLTKLVLITNDPAGPCVAVKDTMQLTFRPNATANVGIDKSICSQDNIVLGVTTNINTGTGFWSSTGTGIFNNTSSLTPTYFPSETDITNGTVKIAFTNINLNDVCANVTDTMLLTINKPVEVTAGSDQTVCASATSIALLGTIGGSASSCSWLSTSSGTFINRFNDTTTYIPNALDRSRGFANLVLSTNDPIGPCPLKRDTVTITLSPVAVVNAGADQNICGNSPVNLNGSYNNVAVFARWTNTSSLLFNSYDSVYTYSPSESDLLAGKMTFILTSSDPIGPCPAAIDSVDIKFFKPVTTNAGPDQVLCATANSVNLQGSFGGGATSVLWVTTNGTGTFDDPTLLNTIYRPSASDLVAKNIQISITTDDPIGPCFAGFDDINIQFKDSLVSFESEIISSTCDSAIVQFNNKTVSQGNNYLWDFGDNDSSTSTNPIHVYKKVGIFNIKLKASSANGCLENINGQVIVNSIKPQADFSLNKTSQCLIDNGFDLSNISKGGTVSWITSILWDFGDSTNSSSTFPNTKKYSQPGNYNIKLTVQTSNGCFDTISKVITVNPGPVKPIITLSAGTILTATSGAFYQWFFNGTPINGANAKTLNTTGYGFYSVRVDSSNGCGTMSNDFELKYNSVNDYQNLVDLVNIYPNPTNGILNIESDQNLYFEIYDVSGKQIMAGNKVQKLQQINLIDLSSGIYFLKLFNDNEQFITKIIRN